MSLFKNIRPKRLPKLSVTFDKETLTEKQFYKLVNFLVQNEAIENIKWQSTPVAVDYILMEQEHAWYSDKVFGIHIYNPLPVCLP